MVQNLRAYVILYIVKIQWKICVQEQVEELSNL